jgi:general stress protein 26
MQSKGLLLRSSELVRLDVCIARQETLKTCQMRHRTGVRAFDLSDQSAGRLRSRDMVAIVADNTRLGEIISSVQVGMLTTVQTNGELRSRPLLCADFDFDSLWFVVKGSMPLMAESMGNRVVNVAFSCPEKNLYASVTGLAQVVEDEKMVQKLWRPEMNSWFSSGLNEPDLALLRVDIHHSEAWDGESPA